MFYIYSFYIAAIISIIGISYRLLHWFSRHIGPEAARHPAGKRILNVFYGIIRTLLGPGVFRLIWTLIVDLVLQIRVLRKDPLGWIMHMLIFTGFMGLLLMHALQDQVSAVLFDFYQPTLNPYLFLRNLFGVMVLAGILTAIFRRKKNTTLKRISTRADRFALFFLLVIMLSGYMLEAAKMVSPSVFARMVEDYAGLDAADQEVEPLKSIWAAEYGAVFPGEELSFDPETLEEGRDMNETYCAFCHSKPGSAFVSYPLSRIFAPGAGFLSTVRFDTILWYIHFLSCFVGLALLPFTKFFHILSTSMTMAINGVIGQSKYSAGSADSISKVNRRAIDLDGCTHCGNCSVHCSVAPALESISNALILPSERLAAIKDLSSGKTVSRSMLEKIAQGNLICSRCNRCTEMCPSGLDLQDIWIALNKQLADLGCLTPGEAVRQAYTGVWRKEYPDRLGPGEPGLLRNLSTVSVSRDDFSECLKCKTCTNSCPVVGSYDDPAAELDLLPHQMMHALGLGLKEMVLGSRMIWACATCYLCQEHCPQGVRITDIFYGLKNLAYSEISRSSEKDGSQV